MAQTLPSARGKARVISDAFRPSPEIIQFLSRVVSPLQVSCQPALISFHLTRGAGFAPKRSISTAIIQYHFSCCYVIAALAADTFVISTDQRRNPGDRMSSVRSRSLFPVPHFLSTRSIKPNGQRAIGNTNILLDLGTFSNYSNETDLVNTLATPKAAFL
ncbi:uncharacterized protein FOMMEDRAFT_162336 [Fomitiporia mediterranea MF3/22]|uniref:uncharacterized protein n=1 Tax=Fomitiporia mediterranea (strain MF3/22) TaxID=694068 RepID=UPI000440861A|nr:uncharacterized protein FOMMEDRAFT_162336 [Fomitiporia mediterranea MF3/22]EJC97993.1 hypothetical protein FOMMEDRAFT_162336 [Fomitiporia mediterranea MF3/22]